jgi:hypothetical protein
MRYLWIVLIAIIIIFAYWSGLFGIFLSDYKIQPIYRGAYVYDSTELAKFQGYWLTEIVDNHYKWRSMIWLPNSDNTGGFVEIGYYERKSHWWGIW